MSYSNFNTFKLFQNVGINSSSDYMLSMRPNNNNVSFHSSNSIDYNNVDIMSIKNIINKAPNEDLNLSSLNGTTINPVITINNNHSDCRIMTNLNVSGNINLTDGGILNTTGQGSFGSISVTSGNQVSNLNAHKLGGNLPSAFATTGHNHSGVYATASHTHSKFNNFVMINSSSNASYPLHVTGSIFAATPAAHAFTDSGGSYVTSRSATAKQVTAKIGDLWITTTDVLNESDRRIKTNIVDVPDNLALQQLRNIPCRYYKYIDIITRGTDETIGFIAQEVKSIIPMAVSQQKKILPNVYKIINCIWTSVNDIFSMSSSDLSNVSNVRYRFYVSNATDYSDEKMIEITGNSDNTFTFDTQYTNVFCYGSEVDDFHILDKAKLFTLNFSATQEIDRIQQTHITEIALLKAENQQQQTEINTLKTENAELTSIIDKLKTANSFEEFKQTL